MYFFQWDAFFPSGFAAFFLAFARSPARATLLGTAPLGFVFLCFLLGFSPGHFRRFQRKLGRQRIPACRLFSCQIRGWLFSLGEGSIFIPALSAMPSAPM